MTWFLEHRTDLARHISYMKSDHDRNAACAPGARPHDLRLLAIPSRERLLSVLRFVLDEHEFLSPFGVRSLSRRYKDEPYTLHLEGQEYRVDYAPGESTSSIFGGNSNWRGPIWLPLNYLLIESLERYHRFYGSSLMVEFPTGSGRQLSLAQVAHELRGRLASLFRRGPQGQRPCHGSEARYATDPHWRDLVLFHEYFHGDTGRGLGATHQTGWTALIAPLMHSDTEREPDPGRLAADGAPCVGTVAK
jgi:hypothetical protein